MTRGRKGTVRRYADAQRKFRRRRRRERRPRRPAHVGAPGTIARNRRSRSPRASVRCCRTCRVCGCRRSRPGGSASVAADPPSRWCSAATTTRSSPAARHHPGEGGGEPRADQSRFRLLSRKLRNDPGKGVQRLRRRHRTRTIPGTHGPGIPLAPNQFPGRNHPLPRGDPARLGNLRPGRVIHQEVIRHRPRRRIRVMRGHQQLRRQRRHVVPRRRILIIHLRSNTRQNSTPPSESLQRRPLPAAPAAPHTDPTHRHPAPAHDPHHQQQTSHQPKRGSPDPPPCSAAEHPAPPEPPARAARAATTTGRTVGSSGRRTAGPGRRRPSTEPAMPLSGPRCVERLETSVVAIAVARIFAAFQRCISMCRYNGPLHTGRAIETFFHPTRYVFVLPGMYFAARLTAELPALRGDQLEDLVVGQRSLEGTRASSTSPRHQSVLPPCHFPRPIRIGPSACHAPL